MSYGYDPSAPARTLRAVEGQDALQGRIRRLGMSPRQQEMNRRWAWYRTQGYDARKVDWDGRPYVAGLDAEAIATQDFIPPGFYDAGASYPLKFRRPTAPYHLAKVVVDRFTGLLFSEKHHPGFVVDGDPMMEDYVNALAESGRLWSRMIQARSFGGACGTSVVGFKFVKGKLRVEIHDPRWTSPTWKDREEHILASIEKRYQFPKEVENPETGEIVDEPHWYRRVITEHSDTLYQEVPVGDGEEPDWPNLIQSQVVHGLGFCPVVWIQNQPIDDEVDGDPDCLGIYDMLEAIDRNIAQADRGITANCDPTLVLATAAKLAEIAKGNDNAIKLPEGGTAEYLEASMSGPEAAMKLAATLRTYALEVAQCVLDHPDVASRTATEITRVYSSMLTKADVLREQYGMCGVVPLMTMILAAIKKLSQGTRDPKTGQLVKGTINLPPRIVEEEGPDGQILIHRFPRVLPMGSEDAVLHLKWPAYFTPGLLDADQAAQAAGKGMLSGVVDLEHAVQFAAPYFGVEDIPAALRKIKAEAKERQADMQSLDSAKSLLGGGRSPLSRGSSGGGSHGGQQG